MYLCHQCGKEVAVTLFDQRTSYQDVCEQCFRELQKEYSGANGA